MSLAIDSAPQHPHALAPSPTSAPSAPPIDWVPALLHLYALGIHADDPVVLTVFPPTGINGPCIHIPTTPETIATGSTDADVARAWLRVPRPSLGFVVNAGGTRNADITECRALFAEDDSDAPTDAKLDAWRLAGLPSPSFQVATGNKSIHHYWVLAEPLAPAEFRSAQKRLTAQLQHTVGGDWDTSLAKPCQVLRLAGAPHPATGRNAELLRVSGELHLAADVLRCCTAPIPFAPTPLAGSIGSGSSVGGDGVPFERLTATAKATVVVGALRLCPQRGPAGSGTYPAAFALLCALVHEFGLSGALDIAAAAEWSQEHWDIAAQAAAIVEPPDPERRIRIWRVFDVAAEHGWQCPWPRQRPTTANAANAAGSEPHQSVNAEPVVDEIAAELRAEGVQRYLAASANSIALSDVLHPTISAFIGARARSFPVDDLMCLAPFIATSAAALGKRFRVEVKRGWTEPMVFWLGTVAPPSSLKSPVSAQFLWPLEQRDEAEMRRFQEEMRAYKATPKDARPAMPGLPRRFVAIDATLEGLSSVLAQDNVTGMVSYHDELSGFIASMDAYRGRSGGKDRAHWLGMWSGGSINIIRKGTEPILVPETCVSLFGNIQQDKLAELLSGDGVHSHSGDGFWARFLWVVPDDPHYAFSRDTTEINAELARIIAGLDTVGPRRVVRLSAPALDAFALQVEAWVAEARQTYPIRAAFLGKMHGHLARFAGLLHALDYVADTDGEVPLDQIEPQIPIDTLLRAQTLCRFFVDQFDRLQPEVSSGDTTVAGLPRWAAKLIRLAREASDGEVTPRMVMRRGIATSSAEARTMLRSMPTTYGLGTIIPSKRNDQVTWTYRP